jgi:hypothetical protein
LTLYVDFDRTLHDTEHPVEGRKMGPPLPGALDAIRTLVESGHTVVVFTVRAHAPSRIKVVADWLAYYQFPKMDITNVKYWADCYIDDRAYRHTDWTDTLEFLKTLKPSSR